MSTCDVRPAPSQRHRNAFPSYDDLSKLIAEIARFLLAGLHTNEAIFAIVAQRHSVGIQQTLKASLGEPAYSTYLNEGRCIFLDAQSTLEQVSTQGWPDQEKFNHIIGHEVALLQQRTNRPIRVFGSMISMLCVRGEPQAAIQLEKLWHRLGSTYNFSLQQDYPLSAFATEVSGHVHDGCAVSPCHSHDAKPAGRPRSRLGDGHVTWTEAPQGLHGLECHLEQCQPLQQALKEREQMLAEQALVLKEVQARFQFVSKKREELENSLAHVQYVQDIAQQTAHLGSWEVDLKTGLVQASDEFFRICGLEPQSRILDLEFTQSIVHPDDREMANRIGMTSFEERKPYKVEKRIIRPDNTIRHVLSQGEFILNDQQEVVKAIGSFLDITELRKAECDLRDSHHKLRQLAAHQENSKEEERKRIARELHDELGGLLTGIKGYLSLLSRIKGNKDEERGELLREAAEVADMAIKAVQRVVNDLRPSVLDQLGIWAAIRWYADRFVQSATITCSCAIDEAVEDIALEGERSVVLFRICQEALTNVIRHSRATAVTVRAYGTRDTLTVEIEDNGSGFDADTLQSRTTWGISGMYERVGQFGGEISIESKVGAGTLVKLSLPLEDVGYGKKENIGVAG